MAIAHVRPVHVAIAHRMICYGEVDPDEEGHKGARANTPHTRRSHPRETAPA